MADGAVGELDGFFGWMARRMRSNEVHRAQLRAYQLPSTSTRVSNNLTSSSLDEFPAKSIRDETNGSNYSGMSRTFDAHRKSSTVNATCVRNPMAGRSAPNGKWRLSKCSPGPIRQVRPRSECRRNRIQKSKQKTFSHVFDDAPHRRSVSVRMWI